MTNNRILLFNPPVNDFSQYDLFSKPYGMLKLAKLLEILNIDFVFIDCLDKNLKYFNNRDLYIKGKTKEDGTGKFYKYEIELPEVLKVTGKKYFRFGLSNEDMTDLLYNNDEFGYIFVNINFSFHYNIIYEIVPILRKHSKNSKIYIGGLFSILYKGDIILNYGNLVNLIDGIAPENLNSFLIFLINNKLVNEKQLNNLNKYLENKKCLFSNCKNYNDINLDKVIFPLWEVYKKLNYGIIRTTVGCPFNCKYCASKIINREFYKIDINYLEDEINFFIRNRIYNIAFYDDALLFDKKHIVSLFHKIENIKNTNNFKNNIDDLNNYEKLSFYLPNAIHIKYFDDEIAYWFKKLNFKMIRFGFESINEESNLKRGYKFSRIDLDNLIFILERNKINKDFIKFYLLIGLPDQTIEEVRESVNYLTERGYKTYFAFYSPIKGTFYYDLILENYRKGKIKNNIEDFLWHNPAIFTFYNTDFNEDLVRKYKRMSREGKII
ncbi:MAG: radical SAM protein [Spirochaetes bacterium]|nr:radical SAM protein [Spirochaetota bacterium]